MPTATLDNANATVGPANGIPAGVFGAGQILNLGNTGDGGNQPPSAISTNGIPDLSGLDVQAQLDLLSNRLAVENRIKDGAENLLQVFENGLSEGKDGLRRQVEAELQGAKTKISNIIRKLNELKDLLPGSSRGTRKYVNANGGINRSASSSSGRRLPGQVGLTRSTSNGRPREELSGQDDFKTSLAQANALIQTLISLSADKRSQPLDLSKGSLSPTILTSPVGPASNSTSNGAPDMDRARIEAMSKLVTTLQRNVRVRYELNVVETVQSVLPALSDYSSKEARAAAYRVIRHVIVDLEGADRLQEQGLDWYIIRTLARDSKHGVEKEQVLKLIRALVDIGASRRQSSTFDSGSLASVPLSEGVMRAIISVAEYPEDPFRLACVLTLSEIVLIDVDLVYRSGGMRVLLQALADGPHDLAPVIATAFLQIIDAPRTRAYLDPDLDLQVALSGFTDAYGKGPNNLDHMRASSRVISVMLRTWSGLTYLCMDDMHAVRSLVDTLRIPSLDSREVILDTFFEVLNIKTPEWYNTFMEGRRLTMYRHHDKAQMAKTRTIDAPKSDTLNVTDQFIALLLLILSECGLLDALVGVLEEPDCDPNISRKATLLLGEILHTSNRVLPLSAAATIQSLPRLFELAAEYGPSRSRQLASNAFSSIDSFNRNRARLQISPSSNKRSRANSVEDPMRRGQRQVEQVKIQMGMQIDDKSFQNLLIETQVVLTRDHTKWNFEVLTDLIEGPLLNPKRLEEAFKATKFGRRLMSFFHPFSHRFSDIKRTRPNMRYVRLGCALLTTLVKSPEGHGIRFLAAEDQLLPQLAECFNQLDPFNGTPSADPIFSIARVEDTLTSGYFEMLGTLSKFPEGIELMERHRLFTSFYHISELRSRDDLIKGIVENIDYTIDGHPRIVLSKALTSSYMHIRLYATKHLGQLIRDTPKANEWTLRLLLTQLYDPAIQVAELAVHFLEDVCDGADILELVVKMQPTLDHLGDIGHPLLLKFMSTPVGFRYLYNSEYIDREMDSWFHERNYHYVVQVEVFLAKAFSPMQPADDDDLLVFDGVAPPHFYGEMAKTALGCQVLQDRGHFTEFAQFIQQHGLEEDDFDIINKLKAILWAVGNIGATSGGLHFLEEEDVIPVIVEIAEQSLVLSVRGTCFYVLGLISSTSQGAEILAEYGWEATLTPLQTATGLCVPQDPAKFLYIPPWDPPPLPDRRGSRTSNLTLPEREVLAAVSNLSNTVIANEAARTLARLKARHPALFTSIPQYCRVMYVISTQRYRLPVRRYILELFEVRLEPSVVQAISAQMKLEYTAAGAFQPDAGGSDRNVLEDALGEAERAIMVGGGSSFEMDSYDERRSRRDPPRKIRTPIALAKYEGFDA